MKRIIIIAALAALAVSYSASAQSTGKVLKSAKTVAKQLRGFDITGTWVYDGVDVQFQSNNLLKKAGGIAAANRIENSIDRTLEGFGFREGITTFVFNEDGTFSNTTADRTLSGTYTLDKDAGTITLRYLNHVPMTASISTSANSISFLFQSDIFLNLASFIGGHSGSSLLGGVSTVLDSYDGMRTGIKLSRK